MEKLVSFQGCLETIFKLDLPEPLGNLLFKRQFTITFITNNTPVQLSETSVPLDVNWLERNIISPARASANTSPIVPPRLYARFREPSTSTRATPPLSDADMTKILVNDFLNRANSTNPVLKGHVMIEKRSNKRTSDQAKAKGCGVHCECLLLQRFRSKASTFPYIGVSKLSCYACEMFFQVHNDTFPDRAFFTKGCHGKLYPKWLAPHLASEQDDIKLRTALNKRFIRTMADHLGFSGESVRIKYRIPSDSTNITLSDSSEHY